MKGGGHGRGITTRGRRAVGVRGINRPVGVPVATQRVATGPQAATTGGLVGRGAGQTRLNVRGTQRGKPQQNLPGEKIRSVWITKRRTPTSSIHYEPNNHFFRWQCQLHTSLHIHRVLLNIVFSGIAILHELILLLSPTNDSII